MRRNRRWDPCIEHRGDDTDDFLAEYFASVDRRVVLIAGAGFDPRATALCGRLSPLVPNLRAILVREIRPNPSTTLLARAMDNIARLEASIPSVAVLPIDIVGQDHAVVGGRNLINAVAGQDLTEATDVVIDVSAMSIGMSYPLIRYLVERRDAGAGPRNLHIVVNQDAALDESIVPQPGDVPSIAHGYRGGWALEANARAAKLWLPQLSLGRKAILQRIHDFVVPHETCPILPFPSSRPRLCDELAEHFLVELESTWTVDPRNLVYAAEDDPLDLYRTLLRIDDLRHRVFEQSGGSQLVLSPTGSKLLALGSLLAALERDLPVVYLEAIGYDFNGARQNDARPERADFIHIWLEGDAYVGPRIPLKGRGPV